jgi:hypothetical protein
MASYPQAVDTALSSPSRCIGQAPLPDYTARVHWVDLTGRVSIRFFALTEQSSDDRLTV